MNVVAYDIEAYPKARNAWGVQSESNPSRWYTVLETREDEWKCACPRWTRNASRPICKHIRFIQNTSAFAPIPETRPLPALP